jgi:hypothetical protein
MNKKFFSHFLFLILTLGLTYAEFALAQAGGFDSKVNGITNMIVGKILPAVSIFGLVYAAILAAVGDESSKRRMVLVVVASIVGILAKFVIPLFQGGM